MKLKKIILKNIRSYVDSIIEFPTGKVLLSGNIGSGKTTVLLAIEFALFGLMRSGLTGQSLLRNGCDKGSVTLFFSIDNKDIEIFRSLKRSKSSVTQDSGYISINGTKTVGTAIELKQKVIELLNYPTEYLTKSNSLIYRYTVYTPQESMKAILLGNQEDRLEALRKVFGIDKYKRIQQNSKVIISKIKEKKSELSGKIFNLNEKIMQREEINNKIISLSEQIKNETVFLNNFKKEVDELNLKIKEFELIKQKNDSIKNKLSLLNSQLADKIKLKTKFTEESTQLQTSIEALKKENLSLPPTSINDEILKLNTQIKSLEDDLLTTQNTIQELKTKKTVSLELINHLSSLENCPTCLQRVSPEHKSSINLKEQQKVKDYNSNLESLEKEHKLKKSTLEELKQMVKSKEKELTQYEVIKYKLNSLKEKESKFEELNNNLISIKKEIGSINLKINEHYSELNASSYDENEYNKLKLKFELKSKDLKSKEISLAQLNTSLASLKDQKLRLDKDISELLAIKSKLEHLDKVMHWLSEDFLNMLQTMEKNIMLKVHSDFSMLFEKWFSILIDNDILSVTLDETFSPLIEQNGFNIDYEYLSGGEKTAAALAYRLALNQIINNLMSDINTRDLVILDEPTDGFSSEQLDRVRDLFNELELTQLIIVSHEPKIESFVDNTIRFEKKEHITHVNY
ncbi:hypothetical protein D6777_00925 [Candidatus Woesearchaeota archaeon]|nr:MAG: hypothetical protein D6777_00925 [Candidatus Woesearchaeota archaeon]